MHRRTMLCAILLAASLVLPGVSWAAPLEQQSQVEITSPEMNAEIRGVVAIQGSASVPDFQFYKVEFGVGPNPAQWAVIGDLHHQPVISGQLAQWDTTVLPDGVYTLRLHGVKRDGNWVEFVVRQLAIVNTLPTPTTTPTGTPTRAATPTNSPTPQATATWQVIKPTAALSVATPTPTISRPKNTSPLPIDPEGWGQSFVFGAAAMAAVFVLFGIVLGLRRLL